MWKMEKVKALIHVAKPIKIRQAIIAFSAPYFLITFPVSKANVPIQNTGIAVKKLTEKLLIFKSCRIVSNKGEIDVIPIRKLMETKNSASIYK